MKKKDIQDKLAAAIASALKEDITAISSQLTKPKNPEHGDFAFPCFKVAKLFHLPPHESAEKLKDLIKLPEEISKASSLGAYLNFSLNRPLFAASCIKVVLATPANCLKTEETSAERVIVEYSSPNIAKPFHVGHLRATLIGNCLERVYRFLGYNVTSINHLGDWGTQFGYVWAGCEIWGKPSIATVTELVELYRKATALKENQERQSQEPLKKTVKEEEMPDVQQMARDFFLKLESGEPEAYQFWDWCREISLDYFKAAYKRLNVSFDNYTGESFYCDKLEGVNQELDQAGILEESQGALGVHLDDKLGFARILTPDGRSLYLTRDIATAMYRAKEFNFDRAIYVVGAPQSLHFEQLKAVLKKLKKSYAEKITHVAFGHVKGMSTRGKGQFIELNSFLDEANERALNAYHNQVSKHPDGLNENRVAEAVSLAAIIFSNLSRNRIKDVEFSWDTALEFQGDTGPYILYAYARINSIKEKANGLGIFAKLDDSSTAYSEESAFRLISLLSDFIPVLHQTLADHEPSHLGNYTLSLAKQFSKVYLNHKIIGAENKQMAEARLALFEATATVLKNSLTLLGMKCLNKM